jgi:hypothetical protein
MKLLLTTEEFQTAIQEALNGFPIFGDRKVSNVLMPNAYSSRSEVTIEFEDEPAIAAVPGHLPCLE